MRNAYLFQMRAKEDKMLRAREEEAQYQNPLSTFPVAFGLGLVPLERICQARMREELLKKFAEDDRIEQLNEHKKRMKADRLSSCLCTLQ